MATTEMTSEKADTGYELTDPAAVAEAVAQYKQELAERKAKGSVNRPPEGKSTWRFLPRRVWFALAWVHNIKNQVLEDIIKMFAALPDGPRLALAKDFGVLDIVPVTLGDGFAVSYCPSKMGDQPCLNCKITSALYKLSRSSKLLEHAAALAAEIQSKQEITAAAVRIDDPNEMKKGPQILSLPTGVWEKMSAFYARHTTDEELGGDFTHPDTGYSIIIDRVVELGPDGKPVMVPIGKTDKKIPKTSYVPSTGRSLSKIKDREWLKNIPDLMKARTLPDETAMRNALEGGGRPAAPALPPAAEKKQIAAPGREPGSDDGDAPSGDPAEWIEDPEAAGDYDTRANLRAKGRRV